MQYINCVLEDRREGVMSWKDDYFYGYAKRKLGHPADDEILARKNERVIDYNALTVFEPEFCDEEERIFKQKLI